MEISKIWRIAALVLFATLAACGGGDDTPTPPVAPLPAVTISVYKSTCQFEGQNILRIEKGRSLSCGVLVADGDVLLKSLPVRLMAGGSATSNTLMSATLWRSTSTGWVRVSGSMNFIGNDLIFQFSGIEISAANPMIYELRFDAPASSFPIPEGEVSVVVDFPQATYTFDPKMYARVVPPMVTLASYTEVVRDPNVPKISSECSPNYFVGLMTLGCFRYTNSERLEVGMSMTYLNLWGDWEQPWLYIEKCFNNMTATYHDDKGNFLSSRTFFVVSGNNSFDASNIKIPGSRYVDVTYTVSAVECTNTDHGKKLWVSPAAEMSFDGFVASRQYSYMLPTTIDLP